MNPQADTTYNGWTNYETWNIVLWLLNSEDLYQETQQVTNYAGYLELITKQCKSGETLWTQDNVCFTDPKINHTEVNTAVWGI